MNPSEGGTPQQNPADTRPANVDTAEINRRVRQLDAGRFARAWREGFAQGAADALREAQRRLPPETWPVLQALSDIYEATDD